MVPAVNISRRQFLRGLGGAALLAAPGSAAYGGWWERHHVEFRRVPLDVGLGHALRVGLISDVHFDPLYEADFFDEAFRRLNAERPDLVLFAGDFVSRTTARFEEFGAVAAQLRPPLGAFAAWGSHDHWCGKKRVRAVLASAGIAVLANEAVPLRGTSNWFIAGLPSFWAGRPDRALFDRYPATARFLNIVHEPDAWDLLRDPRIRLQVSGHTHGGQICAPLVGPLTLPSWGRRYPAGLFTRGDQSLYVNRGLGTVALPLRVFCRPEITLFELT